MSAWPITTRQANGWMAVWQYSRPGFAGGCCSRLALEGRWWSTAAAGRPQWRQHGHNKWLKQRYSAEVLREAKACGSREGSSAFCGGKCFRSSNVDLHPSFLNGGRPEVWCWSTDTHYNTPPAHKQTRVSLQAGSLGGWLTRCALQYTHPARTTIVDRDCLLRRHEKKY